MRACTRLQNKHTHVECSRYTHYRHEKWHTFPQTYKLQLKFNINVYVKYAHETYDYDKEITHKNIYLQKNSMHSICSLETHKNTNLQQNVKRWKRKLQHFSKCAIAERLQNYGAFNFFLLAIVRIWKAHTYNPTKYTLESFPQNWTSLTSKERESSKYTKAICPYDYQRHMYYSIKFRILQFVHDQ